MLTFSRDAWRCGCSMITSKKLMPFKRHIQLWILEIARASQNDISSSFLANFLDINAIWYEGSHKHHSSEPPIWINWPNERATCEINEKILWHISLSSNCQQYLPTNDYTVYIHKHIPWSLLKALEVHFCLGTRAHSSGFKTDTYMELGNL
jgi:hypothetical protein